MKNRTIVVVLAAGEGTRFRSETPKVLHPLLGKSLLAWALDAAAGLKPRRILVVAGRAKDRIAEAARPYDVEIVGPKGAGGTASALGAAQAALRGEDESDLLVLPCNLPLVDAAVLGELLFYHRRRRAALTAMTAALADLRGFGRLVRGEAGALRGVEEADAEPAALAAPEALTGVFAAKAKALLDVLPRIRGRNAAGERHLGDALAILSLAGARVEAFMTPAADAIIPVRTRFDLSRAAAALRDRKNRELMEAGVTITDPATAWIDADVRIAPDALIGPSVLIEGETSIGRGAKIGPGCHIVRSVIGDGAIVSACTKMEEAVLESGVTVGPFARLRARTVLRAGSHVGNFVELKATDFGPGAKAGHLSYLGDSEIGANVNIGAGTITCNFDGVRKNRTVIEPDAFIGSGSELVAPVRVGRGAFVAAGSVITKDVAPDSLAVARGRQVEKPGWAKRKREGDGPAKEGNGAAK
jgi:bifunctional UDP-N-acetylglucosamine pyrophosphorylase/glucosamine-1-phosphate N-acetyltransferase